MYPSYFFLIWFLFLMLSIFDSFIFIILLLTTLTTLLNGASQQQEKAIVGCWGYWESKLLPIDKISWSQITHINYGFVSVNDVIVPSLKNKTQLIKLVGVAHQNDVKALLSIGGWLGRISTSRIASTQESRARFSERVVG